MNKHMGAVQFARRRHGSGTTGGRGRKSRYTPPSDFQTITLSEALEGCGRTVGASQGKLFPSKSGDGFKLYYTGDLSLLDRKCVSVIGSRNISDLGQARAIRVAKELVTHDVVVVSGLANGVDTCAHAGAIAAGGSTIAVIGTPLDRAYPAANAQLQEQIYREHLLLSQFPHGARTYPSDFPARNRVMAALSDASVIVEASDSSGTLHQAAECVRLGRWLFIMKSVVEDQNLEWPAKFLKEPTVAVLESTADILEKIG